MFFHNSMDVMILRHKDNVFGQYYKINRIVV
jgi:hypothetical protein